MVTTEYTLENIPWLERNIPWSNQILFSKGPTPHARIPWRIFHGYDGIYPGNIPWLEWNIPWSNKILFSKGTPPWKNSLVNIPWLRRSISWSNQILFSKGTPPRENSLVKFHGHDGVFLGENSMVMKEYSLVK